MLPAGMAAVRLLWQEAAPPEMPFPGTPPTSLNFMPSLGHVLWFGQPFCREERKMSPCGTQGSSPQPISTGTRHVSAGTELHSEDDVGVSEKCVQEGAREAGLRRWGQGRAIGHAFSFTSQAHLGKPVKFWSRGSETQLRKVEMNPTLLMRHFCFAQRSSVCSPHF